MVALLAENIVCLSYVLVTIALLVLFIGMCVHLRSCNNDLRSIIAVERCHCDGRNERISLKAKFVEFIEMHWSVYKLVSGGYYQTLSSAERLSISTFFLKCAA